MRDRSLFNENWLFSPQQLALDAPDALFEKVTLPHTNRIFPHHNFDNVEYQFISTYRKRFHFCKGSSDQQVFLEFDGVMLACEIYMNGAFLAKHLGGFTPFSVDLTAVLREGGNEVTLYVDSTERKDIPPYGHLVDYLTFGGIYRDVHLLTVNVCHVEDLFVQTHTVLTNPSVTCSITINDFIPGQQLSVEIVDTEGGSVAQARLPVSGRQMTLQLDNLSKIRLWSVDQPVLYTIVVTLSDGGQSIDSLSRRFGFREARFSADGGFYLNGNLMKLVGLNRHQSYPYIGIAAPPRLQRLDADILKNELSCNIVRTSHYPQSPHFLDRCDEIGLLVFEEVTGWQFIGDRDWKEVYLDELSDMIRRDRNHPSVILWGVRVNESPDDDDFYQQTNDLAHQLDPGRQTGGVRCFRESNFLEDVFTYNDFSGIVQDPNHLPYLISEFAGHMFPAKSWDYEERLVEHALYHARIIDSQFGNKKISGAIGWCAFDYATHNEFGSGDRICYHGVMDIFRLPKWAAAFYKSQQPPQKQIVLQPATHWTMGDRSGGGMNPLTIFSNCDEVEVILGDIRVGRFKPDRATYPNLAHPPITVNGLDQFTAWGQRQFHDLHLAGYLEGHSVAEAWISSSRIPRKLELFTDTDILFADGADMTRLIFRITDEFGNILPYASKVVSFELTGDAELIGENPFPLIGGQAALFIKAGHSASQVTVTAQTQGLEKSSITLEIIKP